MKVQSIEQGAATAFYHNTAKHEANLGDAFVAAQQSQAQESECVEKVRALTFKEMVALEHQVKIAFRQGDLIGYERYMKGSTGYRGAIDGAVQEVVAAEEAQVAETVVRSGTFPNDVPQPVKDYVNNLSMKERMILFAQVAVQDIMANVRRGRLCESIRATGFFVYAACRKNARAY